MEFCRGLTLGLLISLVVYGMIFLAIHKLGAMHPFLIAIYVVAFATTARVFYDFMSLRTQKHEK